MTGELHTDRGRSESFGGQADRYDATRPGYPPEAIVAVLGADAGNLRVLDVGCGTGIASRLLAAAGARVLGVEADPAMAEVARQRGSTVEVGRFEQWDPSGRRFDRVVSAQAWHWVDPVVGTAKAADVLVEEGRLCLMWNEGSYPDGLAADLGEVYERLAPFADRYSVLLGAATRDPSVTDSDEVRAIASNDSFTEPVIEEFGWKLGYITEAWVAQLHTHSDHAQMQADRCGRLLDGVGETIDRQGGRLRDDLQDVGCLRRPALSDQRLRGRRKSSAASGSITQVLRSSPTEYPGL